MPIREGGAYGHKSRLQIALAFFTVLLTFTGCALRAPSAPAAAEKRWLADGSITFSRPIPSVSVLQPERLLGFVPVYKMHAGNWLVVDTSAKTLTLMEGEKNLLSLSAQGLGTVKPGEYQILHKQKGPVWYAPDSYFISRRLPIPGKGDVSRFRKGALGDFVLIFNKDIPIHNAPVWSDDVGGIRLNDNDIARLYYLLEIGSPIQVK